MTTEAMRDWHQLFDYVDGDLIWKIRPVSHFKTERAAKAWHVMFSGRKAGNVNKGYVEVFFEKKRIGVHRIVYEMHHGYSPKMVDHIDGNRGNNRIENLRECTPTQNQQNRRIDSNNTSGVKGVHWHKQLKKWTASIRIDGRLKHLGVFSSIDMATVARRAAAEKHHGEFVNHG